MSPKAQKQNYRIEGEEEGEEMRVQLVVANLKEPIFKEDFLPLKQLHLLSQKKIKVYRKEEEKAEVKTRKSVVRGRMYIGYIWGRRRVKKSIHAVSRMFKVGQKINSKHAAKAKLLIFFRYELLRKC